MAHVKEKEHAESVRREKHPVQRSCRVADEKFTVTQCTLWFVSINDVLSRADGTAQARHASCVKVCVRSGERLRIPTKRELLLCIRTT